MKANYEDKIPKAQSTVDFGNLYDVNKQLMDKEPAIDSAILSQQTMALKEWFQKTYLEKYYMLLCHELRDYTLFNFNTHCFEEEPLPYDCAELATDVIECLTNRGTLLAIEQQPDGAWECWIRNSEGSFAYYLFPYGAAVLEYR